MKIKIFILRPSNLLLVSLYIQKYVTRYHSVIYNIEEKGVKYFYELDLLDKVNELSKQHIYNS